MPTVSLKKIYEQQKEEYDRVAWKMASMALILQKLMKAHTAFSNFSDSQ